MPTNETSGNSAMKLPPRPFSFSCLNFNDSIPPALGTGIELLLRTNMEASGSVFLGKTSF